MGTHVREKYCWHSSAVLPVECFYESLYLCVHAYLCVCPQGSLLITSGFSLYLGNLFPVAMDYLRCAAGSVSNHV